jgi:hypothetical protein
VFPPKPFLNALPEAKTGLVHWLIMLRFRILPTSLNFAPFDCKLLRESSSGCSFFDKVATPDHIACQVLESLTWVQIGYIE